MGLRMVAWATALSCGWGTMTEARSETAVAPCHGVWWWEVQPNLPLTFEGMPAEPVLLLPVRWGGSMTSAAQAPLEAISAVVTSPGGEPIAGTLGVGFAEVLDPFDALGGFDLATQVYWRPTAPLEEGTHEVQVAVQGSPDSPQYAGCRFSSFERLVTFEVVSEPAAAPTLVAEASVILAFDPRLWHGAACDQPGAEPCRDYPDICCGYVSEERRRAVFTNSVVATGLSVGGSYHYTLTIRRDPLPLSASSPLQNTREYPVVAGTPVTHAQSTSLSPSGRLPDELCVRATLKSIAMDAEVATVTACVASDEYELGPPLGPPVCSFAECQVAAGDAPDVADERPDEPGPAVSSGGCHGGSSPPVALALALALVALAWRRPRTHPDHGRASPSPGCVSLAAEPYYASRDATKGRAPGLAGLRWWRAASTRLGRTSSQNLEVWL